MQTAMDILLMEAQLRETLNNLLLRITTEEPEQAARLSDLLSDGLMRYWILSERSSHEDEADFQLMLASLEFWAQLHGFPRKKPPQTQNEPVGSTLTIVASG